MKTIIKKVHIKAAPAQVFAALTEKAQLERWFAPAATIDLKPGGSFHIEWMPGMGEGGKIASVEPGRQFSFTWEGKFSPTPTTITFDIAGESGSTMLTLTHNGIGEGTGWKAYAGMDVPGKGWDAHLQDLTTWVETGDCPAPGPRG
ncbi:MAG: SRPBCC family protein [Candidatus Micrarchaeaceae archaeon]